MTRKSTLQAALKELIEINVRIKVISDTVEDVHMNGLDDDYNIDNKMLADLLGLIKDHSEGIASVSKDIIEEIRDGFFD